MRIKLCNIHSENRCTLDHSVPQPYSEDEESRSGDSGSDEEGARSEPPQDDDDDDLICLD